MKTLDEEVLKQIEELRTHAKFQNISDTYNQLEEIQQTIIKSIMMVLSIGLPSLLVIISYMLYSGAVNELNTTEKIIHSASRIIGQVGDLNSQSAQVFGNEISTEGQLKTKLNMLLNMVGVDGNKVKVSDFTPIETSGISEATATIQVQNFSSKDFYQFVQRLFVTDKFKLRSFHIEKNPQNQLLAGSFDISHFSKTVVNNE